MSNLSVSRHFYIFLKRFTKPKSTNEDAQRREFILNLLLLGSSLLTIISIIAAFRNIMRLGENYQGVPMAILCGLLIFFLGLYGLSRLKQHRLAATIFIGMYLLAATYTLFQWGFFLPQGVLTCALIIVMASVLISTRAAFVTTVLIATSSIGMAYMDTAQIITPNLKWADDVTKTFGVRDAVVYVFTFAIILLVSWLSNREIEKSLKRALQSEAALKDERDTLEMRVEERTRELRQAEVEKTVQLYRFAEFGKMASSLIHDLATPLTALSLNLEQIKTAEQQTSLKRAIEVTKRMEKFIEATRKQLKAQQEKTNFSLNDEINQILQVLNHRAKPLKVSLTYNGQKTIKLYGSPVKLHQLLSNLIANAIDAYETTGTEGVDRQVTIAAQDTSNETVITVADNGKGIPKELQEKIFEPFFSTKSIERGTGLGLSICRDIIERDFSGKLVFSSTPNRGTTFTIRLPHHDPATANDSQSA